MGRSGACACRRRAKAHEQCTCCRSSIGSRTSRSSGGAGAAARVQRHKCCVWDVCARHGPAVRVGRARPQARELLDLLEKRLLNTCTRPDWFRELVQAYSKTRADVGLGKASTADSLRKLAWYCSNLVESYALQLKLDALYGHTVYSTLEAHGDASLRRFARSLARVPSLASCVVCYKRSVLFWSDASDDHLRVLESVLTVARAEGVTFQLDDTKLHTTELRISSFVFSKTGMVREDV